MDIAPRPLQEKPVWVRVGGTPASFVRAGQLGLPLFIALLSGPQWFRRLVVGSPQQVTGKLLEIHQTLGNGRYMAQVGLGLPCAETARSIGLLATEIMPAVKRELMGTKTAQPR
ncbi:MAG TPA: hypothetical protein VGK98_18450 [Arthrobacter sp.]|uniref:hypothetical protein n=1 Tax=Arthrobacter sp. TaxID=1667 RepID=UPI002F3F993D